MVPGFSKCGTTTLCDHLADHPEIFIPSTKENNFFVNEDYAKNWHNHFGFYKEAGNQKMIGEGSTFYTGSISEETARKNILQTYPDIRLIFLARDPIDRLESSFREFHNSGAKFGLSAPFKIGEAFKSIPNMVDDTRYWSRFNNYLSHMSPENIHVVFLEDFAANPRDELRGCFEFLGVDPNVEIATPDRQLNSGSSKYYDTRLLRYLRKNPYTGFQLSKLKFERQHRLFKRLGLVRRFKRPVEWDQETFDWLCEEIADDIYKFLEYAGKPKSYWSRFHEIANRTG